MTTHELLAEATTIVAARGRRLSPEDREEVVQDVVQKYLETWTGDDEPVNPAAWLETAVRNRVTDFHRRTERRPEDPQGIGDQDPLALLAGFSRVRQPSRGAVRSRLLQEIFGLVAREDAKLIRRRFLDGASATTVAHELGITPAAVDQRVARAKRALRTALEQRPDLVKELRRGHPHVYPDQRPRQRAGAQVGY